MAGSTRGRAPLRSPGRRGRRSRLPSRGRARPVARLDLNAAPLPTDGVHAGGRMSLRRCRCRRCARCRGPLQAALDRVIARDGFTSSIADHRQSPSSQSVLSAPDQTEGRRARAAQSTSLARASSSPRASYSERACKNGGARCVLSGDLPSLGVIAEGCALLDIEKRLWPSWCMAYGPSRRALSAVRCPSSAMPR